MKVRTYHDKDFIQLTALYKNKAAYGGNFDNERGTHQDIRGAVVSNGIVHDQIVNYLKGVRDAKMV